MDTVSAVLSTLVSDDLGRSGLVEGDVHGLELIRPEQLRVLPGSEDVEAVYDPESDDNTTLDFEAAGGYSIPYYTLYGEPIIDQGKPFSRIRLLGRKSEAVPRYRSPRGSLNHVFIPRGLLKLLKKKAEQNEVLKAVKSEETLTLFITEGEKKAIRSVRAGIPTIALPGIHMWADSLKVRAIKRAFQKASGDLKKLHMSEDTPVNPELLNVIAQIKSLCPNLGVVCILFDSDGGPRPFKEAFKKVKGGEIPVGGIDWKFSSAAGAGMVSANPSVTHAGYLLAAALRKQSEVRCAVVSRFCEWNTEEDEAWKKQGVDDWMESASDDLVRASLELMTQSAIKLWNVIKSEPLFSSNSDPDMMGEKAGPSAEIAFSRMLDGNTVGQADGLLFEWTGSNWQVLNQLRLQSAAHLLIDAFYAESGSARKIMDAPKAAVSAPTLYPIPDERTKHRIGDAIIPCLDVTLDISEDGEIVARAPNKQDGLRYCINARWADRDKPCPIFTKFIESTLPDPAVRGLVQQYIGYTLIGDTRHRVAQWWFGSGSNGKSVLAEIVSALHRKVAAANLSDLGGFNSEGLIDASLITVDETPRRVDEQGLKKAISGGEMVINRKYLPSVTVKLRGKWLLRGNEKPSLSEQTDGIWQRLHIINFEQQFKGSDRDPLLLEKILKNEMAGVLMWAIAGLIKVLKNNGFTDVPDCVWAWKREMQTETDNVLGWWTDLEVQVTDTPRINTTSVYADYSGWCKENGLYPVSSVNFWKRVRLILQRNHADAELTTNRVRETVTDPLTGETRQKWTRQVNLDLYPQAQETTAAGSNVVTMPSQESKVQSKTSPDDHLNPFVELADDDILF